LSIRQPGGSITIQYEAGRFVHAENGFVWFSGLLSVVSVPLFQSSNVFNARDAKEAMDANDTFFRQDLPDSID
jgi:hypothetical protein